MLSRSGRTAARSWKQLAQGHSQRFASHSAHHGEGAHHVASGSGSESFGVGTTFAVRDDALDCQLMSVETFRKPSISLSP